MVKFNTNKLWQIQCMCERKQNHVGPNINCSWLVRFFYIECKYINYYDNNFLTLSFNLIILR